MSSGRFWRARGVLSTSREFLYLQKLVQDRTDLTPSMLSLAHHVQLEILVAIKTGIQAFLHPSVTIPQGCLVEVFLYKRCRNIACQSALPAEDCRCNRTSELLGWVKDVFQQCAPGWDRDALLRELEFVCKIFRLSEDQKGRVLFRKCVDLIERLRNAPADSINSRVLLQEFQVLTCFCSVHFLNAHFYVYNVPRTVLSHL
ncbi:OBERON-like protein [Panicum miliaceum]|uniref:OBERON-like protein n=1 Tax=Panicum miliaceum TaxID=4540 RepID=A0A3L6ST39_PANMI|nr:OBERON-like protein [Panicum miliaceum]